MPPDLHPLPYDEDALSQTPLSYRLAKAVLFEDIRHLEMGARSSPSELHRSSHLQRYDLYKPISTIDYEGLRKAQQSEEQRS